MITPYLAGSPGFFENGVTIAQAIVSNMARPDSRAAGSWLRQSIHQKLERAAADAIIVFASPQYDFDALLSALHEGCAPKLVVGCSSAGEFSGCAPGSRSVSVMALRSDDIQFNAAIATGLRADHAAAMRANLPVFTAVRHNDYPYRSALVLTDVLAGDADEMIHHMTHETHGTYQVFGGGAADDAKFLQTPIFFGTKAMSDAVPVLEMLSKKSIGLGARHGWQLREPALRVTAAEGIRLISLNATIAVEIFEQHARATGQTLDKANPLPFFCTT